MYAWLPVLLALAVVFVNGWTDAPNAIAAAVASNALSFRRAALLAAVCDGLGAAAAMTFWPVVADRMWALAGLANSPQPMASLCAAFGAVVLWAAAAWRFGIPTSESHALLAGLAGAALARPDGLRSLEPSAWAAAGWGMVLSLLLGAGLGALSLFLLNAAGLPAPLLRRGQVALTALAAFLHGAQDGQKCAGLLLFTLPAGGPLSPRQAAVLCAAVMALGALLGGRPIVEKVGRRLVALRPASALASDVGGCAALLVCTLAGLPVSTTHAKTAAVAGAGWSDGKPVDRTVWRELALTWLFTFPGCALLAFLLARIPRLLSI